MAVVLYRDKHMVWQPDTRAEAIAGTTRAVWAVARAAAWLFYRVERLGPPLPGGPLLLVANHPNGLLDPALVVATSGRVPRFLAKSTLFSGAPYSVLVRWSGAIPVYRRHDPGAETERNAEMFAAVQRALGEGHAVCLFPEGISHSSGRVEPLKTGAARIVLAAEAAGLSVALVAVGLNFTNKGIFRSPATVAFGPAFSAQDIRRLDDPLASDAVNALTARIADHIRDVVVEADPRADAELVVRVERLYAATRKVSREPGARLTRERAIARGLDVMRLHDPDRLARMLETLRRHEERLARFGLGPGLQGPAGGGAVMRFLVKEVPLAFALGPVAAAAAAAFAVPYVLVDRVASRRSVDHEIQATVKVLGGAVAHAVWIALLAAAAGAVFGRGAGLLAALVLPVLGVAGVFALEREGAVLDAARTWVSLRRTSPRTLRHLRRTQEQLATLLDDAHAWVSRLDHPPAPSDTRSPSP